MGPRSNLSGARAMFDGFHAHLLRRHAASGSDRSGELGFDKARRAGVHAMLRVLLSLNHGEGIGACLRKSIG